MRKLILSLTALGSLTTTVFANLGETLHQSIERYGQQPYQVLGNRSSFAFNGWWIQEWVNPDTGIVDAIWYTKADGPPTLGEVYWIVNANLPPEDHDKDQWVQGDKKWVQGQDGYSMMTSPDGKYVMTIGGDTGEKKVRVLCQYLYNRSIMEDS
jgi:hypothetical protein